MDVRYVAVGIAFMLLSLVLVSSLSTTITSPADGYVSSTAYVPITCAPADGKPEVLNLYVDGQLNGTAKPKEGEPYTFNVYFLDGTYDYYCEVCDKADCWQSGTQSLTVSVSTNSEPGDVVEYPDRKVLTIGDLTMTADMVSSNNTIYPNGLMKSCPVWEVNQSGELSAVMFCSVIPWEKQEYNLTIFSDGKIQMDKWKWEQENTKAKEDLDVFWSETEICENVTHYNLTDEYNPILNMTEPIITEWNETVCKWTSWNPLSKFQDKYGVTPQQNLVVDPIVSACGTLNTAGGYYQMNQSIWNSSDTCISITADNITLDCNGSTIDGTRPGTGNKAGIYAYYQIQNITIANCSVQEFDFGVSLDRVDNSTVYNITSTNNTLHGIEMIESCDNNRIYNITANDNDANGLSLGILFENNNNNTISNITANDNSDYGVIISCSDNDTLSNITTNNNGYGTSIHSSSNNTLSNINADLNYNGISLTVSSNNTLSNITANSNDFRGIYFYSSSNNTLSNINADLNYYGIYLRTSSDNTLSNITANSNDVYGIHLRTNSSNNTLSNITANSNTEDGIHIESSSDNTLSNITANSNTEDGIYIESSSNNTLSNINADLNHDGIYLYDSSSNSTLTNISASSNTHIGIYLYSSSNNTLSNITANSNPYYGIVVFSTSSNNIFTDITANSNGFGILVYPASSNNIFTNATISPNSQYNVYLISAYNTTFLNATYTNESVDGTSELIRKWFVDFNITSISGDEIAAQTVTVYNQTNQTELTFTTTTGIDTQELREYVNTSTTLYATPHIVLVTNTSNLYAEQVDLGVWNNNATNISLGQAISFVPPTHVNTTTINSSYIPINITLNFTASACNATINGTDYALAEQNETNFYTNISWAGSDGLVRANVTCTSSLSVKQFMSLTLHYTINSTSAPADTTPPEISSCLIKVGGNTYTNSSTIEIAYSAQNATLVCVMSEQGNISYGTTFDESDIFPIRNIAPLYTFKDNITLSTAQDTARTTCYSLSGNDTSGNEADDEFHICYTMAGTGGGGSGGGSPPTTTYTDSFILYEAGGQFSCPADFSCRNSVTFSAIDGKNIPIPLRACGDTVIAPPEGVWTICNRLNISTTLTVEVESYTTKWGDTKDFLQFNETLDIGNRSCTNLKVTADYPDGSTDVFRDSPSSKFAIIIKGNQQDIRIPVESLRDECGSWDTIADTKVFGIPWWVVIIVVVFLVLVAAASRR